MHNSSSECKKLRVAKSPTLRSPTRLKSEEFTLDIVPGGKSGGKAQGTTKASGKGVRKGLDRSLNSRAPHDLVAALRSIVDESDIGGISPDQVATLGRKWLMDRRHIKGLTARAKSAKRFVKRGEISPIQGQCGGRGYPATVA
jgi:hypothetical protein